MAGMEKKNEKRKFKKMKIIAAILVLVLVLSAGFGAWYVQDYYHASQNALSLLSEDSKEITILEEENKQIAFVPEEIKAGLIFYPGGKVEFEAYVPLMMELAQRGILCVLVHMPANLAVLDSNAADGIQDDYPQVSSWYLAGHSLGGAMASSYIAKHIQDYDGLILLGAYSTSDLNQSDLTVLSIYGSEDGVLNRESYQKNTSNLPDSALEFVIEGGCHSYFGDYGMQEGDGTPFISRQEQLEQTADLIMQAMDFNHA
jgi:hypothetical protein